MKKIALALLSTITVVVLLFGYHTSTEGALGAGGAATPPAIISGGADSGRSDSSSSGASSGADSGGSDEPEGSTPAPSASATPAEATTVTGVVAQTQWGPVQVQLSVQNGAVSNVDVLQYPNGNPRDADINDYALPILIKETLSAQNAQIDTVSGATVTSDGYLSSLQSALDQAGL